MGSFIWKLKMPGNDCLKINSRLLPPLPTGRGMDGIEVRIIIPAVPFAVVFVLSASISPPFNILEFRVKQAAVVSRDFRPCFFFLFSFFLSLHFLPFNHTGSGGFYMSFVLTSPHLTRFKATHCYSLAPHSL